jgi:hypothetical protein
MQRQEEPGRSSIFTILVWCIPTVLFPGSVTRSGQLHTRMVIPHFTMTCITCFSRYLISTSSIPLFSPKAKCVISAFLPFSPTVVQKVSSQSGQLDSQAVISIPPSLDSPTLLDRQDSVASPFLVYTVMLSLDSPHSDPLVTFYKASGRKGDHGHHLD